MVRECTNEVFWLVWEKAAGRENVRADLALPFDLETLPFCQKANAAMGSAETIFHPCLKTP